MSSLFARARDWLPAQMQSAATSGNAVAYTRHGTSGAVVQTITLTDLAWRVRGQTALTADHGALVVVDGDAWMIPASELSALSGGPQVGDRITETVGGVATVFEVLTPDNGQPAVRWSDSGRATYRVFVKQVK